MDLNYSTEEAAFRDEVRGWLEQNTPRDLRDKMTNYEALTKEDLLRWHTILAKKGWVAPDWPVEWGGTDWNAVQRYIFEEEMGYAGCPPLVSFGLRMCAPGALPLRHRRAEAEVPAAHLQRGGLLVPGVLRAGVGLRSGLAEDAGGPSGRPLRRHRPEDLDDARPLRRLDLLPGAHRCERQAPGGHLLPPDRHEDARHHRAADHPDGRRPRRERGVLRRGEGARREPRSRGGQGLDGGEVPPRPRAHGHRPGGPVQARAPDAEGAGRLPT